MEESLSQVDVQIQRFSWILSRYLFGSQIDIGLSGDDTMFSHEVWPWACNIQELDKFTLIEQNCRNAPLTKSVE